MSGTLSATTAASLAPILQSLTSAASLGSTGYNLYNQYQNQQYQNQLRSYAQDPAKMNAYAAKFTQPLTAGLTAGVANQAQADLASRGLSDSPEIAQQVYAQAIAPYIQQNQQNGYQNALQALQLGGGAIPPAQQQANGLAGLAKAFSQFGQGGGAGALPGLADYLRTMGTQPQQLSGAAAPPPPIDTSSWNLGPGAQPDLSSFYTPDYTAPAPPDTGSSGGGDAGAGWGG